MPGTRRSGVHHHRRRSSGSAVLEVGRLLDARGAAVARAVGQVLARSRRAGRRTARTPPTSLTGLPSARLMGAAVGLLARKRLQAGLVDHMRPAAAAELRQPGEVVARRSRWPGRSRRPSSSATDSPLSLRDDFTANRPGAPAVSVDRRGEMHSDFQRVATRLSPDQIRRADLLRRRRRARAYGTRFHSRSCRPAAQLGAAISRPAPTA
jgi:hypothetical protein